MKQTRKAYRAALFLAAAAAVAGTGVSAQPVAVRADPVTEIIHGITLTDEYRWMEDPANRDELLTFVEAENARTRAMFDALPERAWFARRLGEVSSSLERVGSYKQCGDTALFLRSREGDRLPKLTIRDAAGERAFLDPAVVTGDPLAAFGAYEFAPDCRRVSIHVSSGGSEAGKVLLLDIATGQQIGPAIERIWGEFTVSFIGPDKVLYTQMAVPAQGRDPIMGMTAYVAPVAGGSATQVLGNGMEVPPENLPIIIAPVGEPFALGIAAGARADNEFWIAPADSLQAGSPQWRKVAGLEDKAMLAATRGRALFVQTTRTNPLGTLLRYPLGEDGMPGAPEVVFEGSPERLLRAFQTTADGVYVVASRDGASQLFFLPDGRGPAQQVALPFEGTILNIQSDADGKGASLIMVGWTQGTTVFRLKGTTITLTGIAAEVWDGAKDMAVTRAEAVSKDGTRVPMVVLRRKGASGRTPTMVEGYGAYATDNVEPVYVREQMAWLDKGGAFAWCGTRGGGERGRDWYEGGRGPNKPRGMEDLAACAEALTAMGIAPERGPLVTGASMAGTLVPTATLRHPQAFGAMVTRVGIVNPARIGAAENGANQFAEIGNPADPQQFRDLLAMDAYHMITASPAPPPPTLMMIGLNDRRVAPWMTAKWVARARAKWPDAPIWLRGDTQAGHGVGTAEDVRIAQAADTYAFAWEQQSR
ncbi:MAG: prolyl oligopeptidase family serine peptidase [Porphyrobacter sp.]|nr:prolyl oligopeptidase family serine peptidase [Porphyrobacter sp.]